MESLQEGAKLHKLSLVNSPLLFIFNPNLILESKEESVAPAAMATKNFFMDIYAKEVSKMQSASKSSAPAKKRNFDATQFNTYGRPLGEIFLPIETTAF